MKHVHLLLGVLLPFSLHAQPDTLWVPVRGVPQPFDVVYAPVRDDAQYKRIGRYAMDTSKVAVELDHKRGTPSGIYRAYYPDGRPLIFAVYGWGSLHGDWTEYDETGAVHMKGQYRQGKRNGPWAFRKEGVVGRYKKGLKHGKWKFYEGKLRVRTEKFKRGRLVRTRTFGPR